MNYDRNGVLATTSRPKPVLRKCYRVVTVDSRDRDPTKFVKVNGGATVSDPGDYVVYLPRPFQKVTRIRLMNAALLGVQPSDTYIMMQLEGLNRMDECASGADRSGYVDSAFAKILNDRPVVATGAAYTYSTITGITNRTFSGAASTATITTGNTTSAVANTLGTVITFTASTNTFVAGQTVTITGYSGAYTVLNGSYVVLSATGTVFVVSSTTPIPAGNTTTATTVTVSTSYLSAASGDGTRMLYTFSGGPHNIAVGQTITIAGTTGLTGANMTGIVTSVPSLSTFTMASTANGTATVPSGASVTVNNLQYSYVTTITTSFVTGQYLVISGFTSPNAAANAAAQILQSSLSTGTSGTFETTNVATLTAAQTAGTAIISQAIYYNDMSYAPNITYYNPPIGTLDRLHITLRRHLPLSSVTATNPTNAPITFGPAENTFAFEIEYIDNVFEDVSAFETRLDNADYTPKFQV